MTYTWQDLKEIMASLRNKEAGCPWDLEQNFQTIAPYTLEETHEVLEAIANNDKDNLREELGDLLFQIFFYAQMAEEEKSFTLEDVVQGICEKMIRRHPHVFDNKPPFSQKETIAINAQEVSEQWQRIKQQEKIKKTSFFLDEVNQGMPALTKAMKLQKKAAQVGFDWPSVDNVLDKLQEEIAELKAEIVNKNQNNIQAELGDVLFCVVNLARHTQVDCELALKQTNHKFYQRFNYIEASLMKEGKSLANATLEEMEDLWLMAKKYEDR